MNSLFIVEDGNYKFVVKANSYNEAKEKVINWCANTHTLRLNDIGVDICDNDEVIE